MADTEQSTENEETTATEEPAGGEDTPVAEATGDTDVPVAEDPPVAEDAAVAEEPPAAAAVADAEPAVGDEEAPAVEPAPEAAAEPASGAAGAAAHTYEELKAKTVVQMREIAEGLGEHDALHGYTTMHKEELLVALCAALGIEAHERHEVVGIDKTAVKTKIRDLKKQRDALVEAKDAKQLKLVRARIRRLKRKIHKATV